VSTPNWIDLDGVVNMRDVGGMPTTDGGRIAKHRLLRSDNLQELSERDVELLVDTVGVSDIVDLRSDIELRIEGPGPLQVRELVAHHHHSLFRDDLYAVSAEDALVLPWSKRAKGNAPPKVKRDDDHWASHYLGYLADRPDSVVGAPQDIAEGPGPVVVHCAAGKDRTGVVAAVLLGLLGVGEDDIVADYALTAEIMPKLIDRIRAYAESQDAEGDPDWEMPPPHVLAAEPDTMRGALAVLREEYGSFAGYARVHGVDDAVVDALRAALVE